jgi:ferredoxin
MLELNFSSPSAMSVFARNITRSTEILARVREKISIPVGLKLSPTLEPLETLVASWTDAGLDFITAHNAPSGILIDVESLTPFGAPAIGGYVSGRPFLPYSLARVVRIKRVSDIPVIGVGGIYEGSDALQYLLAGCPLVGVGSALYFKGPGVLDDIYQGLTEWMRRKGFRHIEEFRGKVLPLIRGASALKSEEEHAFTMPPDCPYAPSIDHDRCTRCGTCTTSCIYGALILAREKQQVVVLEERCWSCGFCVGICPVGAIELRERLKPKRLIWNNQGVARSFVKGV